MLQYGLRERKTLEVFDWNSHPELDKRFILELGRLDFVRRRDDLVFTGRSGTGKSHILTAFGLRACEQAISMRYARCVGLLDDLHAGLADGTACSPRKRVREVKHDRRIAEGERNTRGTIRPKSSGPELMEP